MRRRLPLSTVAHGRPGRSASDSAATTGSCVVALGLWLVVTVLLPLWAPLSEAFQAADGSFVGLANFAASIWDSLWVSLLSTAICVLLAFAYAYGLLRTCMPARGPVRIVAQIPILAPSLLPAISLVYLFGTQGLAKGLLLGASIYGPIGIVMGEVFWTFPHALIIITTALAIADARPCGRARAGSSGRSPCPGRATG